MSWSSSAHRLHSHRVTKPELPPPFPTPTHPDQHPNSRNHQPPAVHCPLGLPRHETPRQDIDSLQDPCASHQQTQHAHNVQHESHRDTES